MPKFLKFNRYSKITIKYGFVSVVALAIDYGGLILLSEVLNLYYVVSAILSFLLGLFTNYLLSVYWAFDKRQHANRTKEFIIFSIIGIVALVLNVFLLWSITELFGIPYYISKIIATGFTFFFNLFLRKKLVF